MRLAARLVSLAALVATIVPPVLFFTGQMELDAMKLWMLVATVAWFFATPIWMDRSPDPGLASASAPNAAGPDA